MIEKQISIISERQTEQPKNFNRGRKNERFDGKGQNQQAISTRDG